MQSATKGSPTRGRRERGRDASPRVRERGRRLALPKEVLSIANGSAAEPRTAPRSARAPARRAPPSPPHHVRRLQTAPRSKCGRRSPSPAQSLAPGAALRHRSLSARRCAGSSSATRQMCCGSPSPMPRCRPGAPAVSQPYCRSSCPVIGRPGSGVRGVCCHVPRVGLSSTQVQGGARHACGAETAGARARRGSVFARLGQAAPEDETAAAAGRKSVFDRIQGAAQRPALVLLSLAKLPRLDSCRASDLLAMSCKRAGCMTSQSWGGRRARHAGRRGGERRARGRRARGCGGRRAGRRRGGAGQVWPQGEPPRLSPSALMACALSAGTQRRTAPPQSSQAPPPVDQGAS